MTVLQHGRRSAKVYTDKSHATFELSVRAQLPIRQPSTRHCPHVPAERRAAAPLHAERRRAANLKQSPSNSSMHHYKLGGSVAEWLACWTQARKVLGSNRSHDAVLGKLFTPVVPLFTKQRNW